MALTDAGRPQDQGRRHRKRAEPSPATASLLADYHDAMRAELRGLLVELAGSPAPAGLLEAADAEKAVSRPSLADRTKMWELAIKIGRELGSEVDRPPPLGPPPPAPRPRKARVDYG